MKKRTIPVKIQTVIILFLSMILICNLSLAESNLEGKGKVLTIDLANATDEELEAAKQAIIQEQKDRIVTKVTFEQKSLSIPKGKNAKIEYAVTDLQEGVKVSKTSWASSDTSVATVQNGNVRAVNGGKTTITCTVLLSDGTELEDTCKVTVVVIASGLTINPNNITLEIDKTQQLKPVIKPDNVSSTKLSYKSDDSNIVSVDKDGKIKAVHGGKTTITISTTDGSNKSAKVTVYVPSISASKTEYTVTDKKGLDFKIKYYGTRSNLSVTQNNGNYASVSHSLSGNDLTISVTPKVAGAITVTVSDKSDNRSKVSLKVTIAHSAVYDKQSYPAIQYTDAFRYPNSYQGDKVSFSGRVLQVMSGWGTTEYRISSRGRYDDVVYVSIDDDDILTPILEDDNVTVYGTYDGTYTYESIFGASITIPMVNAERINVR